MAPTISKSKSYSRKIKCAILWSILIIIPFFLLVYGDFVIDKTNRLHRKVQVLQSHYLLNKKNVVFLSTLDDSNPYDAITLRQLKIIKLPLVKGKHGEARKFDPQNKDYAFLQHGRLNNLIQDNGTYSMWIKPFSTTNPQQLINANNSQGGFKLFIEKNNLLLNINHYSDIQIFSTPFNTTNEFSHIAITFNKDELSLFLNGVCKINIKPEKGIATASRTLQYNASFYPIHGILDDIAIWRRTLSQEEIKKIASSNCNIKTLEAPLWAFAENVTDNFTKFLSYTYRIFDRSLPSIKGASLINSKIPILSLRMSKKDERHFKNQHDNSLKNGYRTGKAANFRKIHAIVGNDKIELELALDDVYHFQNRSKRQAYLLKDKSNKLLPGSGVARIYPPELHLPLHPDAPKPLPLQPNLVKLYTDGAFKGIYVFELFDRSGSAWMAFDERNFVDHSTLYANGMPANEDIFSAKTGNLTDYKAALKAFKSDLLFPWSTQEIKAREKECLRRRQELQLKDSMLPIMHIKDILGQNRTGLYITQDLEFPTGKYKWHSSDTQILSHSGNVKRPKGHTPKFVKLTCEEKGTDLKQEFVLRVMPLEQPIDTLFIYIGQPLSKTQRADFTCLRIPKGGGKPEWNIGFASQNAGVKQRGNTSYQKGSRRSLLLKFNTAVSWHNSKTPARHVILYSGYADATRLRNKISFDAFTACDDGKSPQCIPKISFSEVFINDEYFGIYETSQRVKDICPKDTLLYKVRARDANLWNTTSTEMVECVNDYKQSIEDPYAPICDIFTFTMDSTPESLAKNGHEKIWLNNLTSFFLILNFTENYDGVFNNQYIACDPQFNKWYLIPWDYDKTFFAKPDALLQNSLFGKLRMNPKLASELSKKWTDLRNGPLSDENIFKKINHDITTLKPYLENERNWLYPESDAPSIEHEFSSLKTAVKKNLMRMDNAYLIQKSP